MPRTTQPHAHRAGECATCLEPRPAGHDRYCPGCLPAQSTTCSSAGCRVRLPRRADGAAQTCPGCADQGALELDVVPIARSRRGKRPAA